MPSMVGGGCLLSPAPLSEAGPVILCDSTCYLLQYEIRLLPPRFCIWRLSRACRLSQSHYAIASRPTVKKIVLRIADPNICYSLPAREFSSWNLSG